MSDDIRPGEAIEHLIAAYNEHDLGGFLACHDERITVRTHPTGEVLVRGHDELKARYQPHFREHKTQCTVLRRIVFGSFVIDHVEVTGLPEQSVIPGVSMYQIENGLVTRVWLLEARQEPSIAA